MLLKNYLVLFFISCLLYGCTSQQEKSDKVVVERKKPATDIAYHYEKPTAWLQQHKSNAAELHNVFAVNRTDSAHLMLMDSILIPNDAAADITYYLPFPLAISNATGIDKVIFFSYPTQSFGAYENGRLVYTGPTNMGRKADPTPTGLYFTNWKAEKTTSTSDDEWELKWNFNIENKEGIGWHEYSLPGYPASHSCLRLQETDARYLYTWAQQWVMDHDTVKFKGTPVVVFGGYDFNGTKPWLQLVNNIHALDISDKTLSDTLAPYLPQIIEAQQKRKTSGV